MNFTRPNAAPTKENGISGFFSLPKAPKPASQSSNTQSPILWGTAAAAAVGAFNTVIAEKKRKEAEARAKHNNNNDHAKRRAAEKAGTLGTYLRGKRKEKAAQRKAKADRIRRKDQKKRDQKQREKSGLSDKEWKKKQERQAIWDANGAAIYEANKAFESEHGHKMDSTTREKAIAEATVGGVFNAGLYSTNLGKAQEEKEEEEERIEAQQALREKSLSQKESFLELSDLPEEDDKTQSLADWREGDMAEVGAAVDAQKKEEQRLAGLQAYYDGRKAGEERDPLAEYMRAEEWRDKHSLDAIERGHKPWSPFPPPERNITVMQQVGSWMRSRVEPFVRYPPPFLSVSYNVDMPFSPKNLFTDELISYQPSAHNIFESMVYQKDSISASSTNIITSNPSGRLNLNTSYGRLTFRGSETSSGQRTDYFIQPGALSFGQIISAPSRLTSNARDINVSAFDIDLVGKNWTSFKVSHAVGTSTPSLGPTELRSGEEYSISTVETLKGEINVHRSPRALLAIVALAFALEAGLGAAVIEAIPSVTIIKETLQALHP